MIAADVAPLELFPRRCCGREAFWDLLASDDVQEAGLQGGQYLNAAVLARPVGFRACEGWNGWEEVKAPAELVSLVGWGLRDPPGYGQRLAGILRPPLVGPPLVVEVERGQHILGLRSCCMFCDID